MTDRLCPIEGCGKPLHGSSYCNAHYRMWKRYGDPLHRKIRKPGEGTPHISGYWMYEVGKRSVLRHVLIAEAALGHPLPPGAQVHHVDGDRSNDAPSNLVICPSAAYHQLLHRRTRAFDACGHADWRQCSICKRWSPEHELRIYQPSGNTWHPACRRANPVRRKPK